MDMKWKNGNTMMTGTFFGSCGGARKSRAGTMHPVQTWRQQRMVRNGSQIMAALGIRRMPVVKSTACNFSLYILAQLMLMHEHRLFG